MISSILNILKVLKDIFKKHLLPKSPINQYILGIIILYGAFLRWWYIHEPIRFDEAANALYYANRTIFHAIGSSGGNENHGLNSFFMWISVHLFGWNEFTVRFPVALVGTFSIWGVFSFTKWLTNNDNTSMYASLLIAVSPWMVFYSVNARGYMYLLVLFALLIGLFYKQLNTYQNNKTQISIGILVGFISILGAFAVRSMLIFVGGAGLAYLTLIIVSGRKNKTVTFSNQLKFIGSWLSSTAILTFLFFAIPLFRNGIAGLLGVAHGYHDVNSDVSFLQIVNTSLSSYLKVVPKMIDSTFDWLPWIVYSLGVLGVFLSYKKKKTQFLIITLLFTLLTGIALSLFIKQGLYSRILVPLVILVIPFISIVINEIGSKHWVLKTIILLGISSYPVLWSKQDLMNLRNETGNLPMARPVAKALLKHPTVNNTIFIAPPLWDACLAFYFKENGASIDGFADLDLAKMNNDTLFQCSLNEIIQISENQSVLSINKYNQKEWYKRIDQNSGASNHSMLGNLYLNWWPLRSCDLNNDL